MKHRLVAGTINHWPDDDEWRNYTLDVANRPIWSSDLDIAVQPNFVCDLAAMPMFREAMFDEVRAHHVLEHLARDHATLALQEIHRILKPAGILDVEVPDIGRVTAAWAAGELDVAGFSQWLYGEQLPEHQPGDSHRWPWTEEQLRVALEIAGFRVDDPEPTGLAVRFRAVKR